MQLEEAKEQLESLKEDIKSNIDDLTDIEDVFVQDVLAIETVIQEIETLQKSNAELQKENEGYISGELMTRNQAKHFEEINKKYYIHKDNIRDCLDDIEDYFERVSVPYEDIEFIKEKRKDLLKEE